MRFRNIEDYDSCMKSQEEKYDDSQEIVLPGDLYFSDEPVFERIEVLPVEELFVYVTF